MIMQFLRLSPGCMEAKVVVSTAIGSHDGLVVRMILRHMPSRPAHSQRSFEVSKADEPLRHVIRGMEGMPWFTQTNAVTQLPWLTPWTIVRDIRPVKRIFIN